MLIGLNGRFLAARPTGVQRFALEMARRLVERAGVWVFAPRGAGGEGKAIPGAQYFEGRLRGALFEQLELPGRLVSAKVEVALHLANSAPLAGAGRIPQVIVVHDVTPLTHPEWYTRRFALWYGVMLRRSVARAAAVATVSRAAKEAVCRELGLPAERVRVVTQGLAPFDRPAGAEEVAAVQRRFGLDGVAYVLAVGGWAPRKNVRFLVDVVSQCRARGLALELVVVGEAYRGVHRDGRVERPAPFVRVLGHVTDRELRALYTGARVFAFPSLAEGFGRPPVEALACGAPVIAAEYPAAREVLGEAASVLPLEVGLWADRIEELCRSPRVPPAGGVLFDRVSWERGAEELLEMCREVAGPRAGSLRGRAPRAVSDLRVAIVHDWLTGMRGGERVLEAFLHLFPRSEIFTLVHVKGAVSSRIEARPIHTSFLDAVPGIARTYRYYLPLFPFAVGRFDLRGFDLVVSISHCVAKGVRVPPGVPHLCYCLTPMRYVWDQFDAYFGPGRAPWPVRVAAAVVRPRLQRWDRRTAPGVTQFVACSSYVAERVRRVYGREAVVVHPPVELEAFRPAGRREEFFLTVSALVPYKRVDLLVRAFARLGLPLVVVGEGSERPGLVRLARRLGAGRRVQFTGWLSRAEVARLMGRCRAFVYAAAEDFGLVYVEALAAGAPLIAYGVGGIADVVSGEGDFLADGAGKVVGVRIGEQSVEAVVEAVRRFQEVEGMVRAGGGGLERFGVEAFRRGILRCVQH